MPEYRFFDTVAERDAALEAIGANRALLHRGYWAAAILTPIAAFGSLPLGRLLRWLGIPNRFVPYVLLALLVLALTAIVLFPWRRTRWRRALREYLAARGIAVCVTCGYDLRGAAVERCPECFTPRTIPNQL